MLKLKLVLSQPPPELELELGLSLEKVDFCRYGKVDKPFYEPIDFCFHMSSQTCIQPKQIKYEDRSDTKFMFSTFTKSQSFNRSYGPRS